jgi:hypothetical protein
MADRFPLKEVLPITPEKLERFRASRQRNAPPVPAPPQPAELGTAQHRELPATLLKLEPQPLSAYDDNPVLNEAGAAFIVGVTADALKKWRQRKQGPDYIQYGKNGPVRYELRALMEFRDKYRVVYNSRN